MAGVATPLEPGGESGPQSVPAPKSHPVVKPPIQIPNEWQTRPYQRDLWEYLAGGGLRACAVWHRRAGKDTRQLASSDGR